MRARIDKYFGIVVRNVRDFIPKSIGYFLVKMAQEKLPFQLYDRMNKNKKAIDLLGEPKHVAEERATVTNTLMLLEKSLKVLRKDPEYNHTLFTLWFLLKFIVWPEQSRITTNPQNVHQVATNHQISPPLFLLEFEKKKDPEYVQ